jgi:hypothetical protein
MTLDELVIHVTELTGAANSAEALLGQLHQMLTDALATGDLVKIQAIADAIDQNTVALAAAVAANPAP